MVVMQAYNFSCADLEKSDIKSKTDDQQESLKLDEYESCEKGAPKDKIEEEDVCPICLEGCFSLDHLLVLSLLGWLWNWMNMFVLLFHSLSLFPQFFCSNIYT